MIKASKIQFNILCGLMLLIGMNFNGMAVFLFFVCLGLMIVFSGFLSKVPMQFIGILALYISIVIALIINGETNFNSLIKFMIYPFSFYSFYCFGIDGKKEDDNYDKTENFLMLLFFFQFGNIIHLFLDMRISNLTNINMGRRIINDIWSNATTPVTVAVGWGCFLTPMLLYACLKKNRNIILIITAVISTLCYLYFSLVSATRLGILNIIVILAVYLILRAYKKRFNFSPKKLLASITILVLVIFIGRSFAPFLLKTNLFKRLEDISFFNSNGRIQAASYLLTHFTDYLWGGNYFRRVYGLQQHDLFLQIYDSYGIIPALLCFASAIRLVQINIKIWKNKLVDKNHKYLLILCSLAYFLYALEEPIISSNFIISAMLFVLLGYLSAM